MSIYLILSVYDYLLNFLNRSSRNYVIEGVIKKVRALSLEQRKLIWNMIDIFKYFKSDYLEKLELFYVTPEAGKDDKIEFIFP
jgi:hypothetical protein